MQVKLIDHGVPADMLPKRAYRCVAGYTIEMAGRNGAKTKSELIRLPGTK